METIFTLVFGAIIGSFLSVCIYRIPLGRTKGLASLEQDDSEADITLNAVQEPETTETLTIASPPRSLCPNCSKQLLWWHNIPILSWLLLGGKCGFCKTRISFRYPLVELCSALLCMYSFRYYDVPTAIVIYCFCATLLVLSFIDIDYYILPNVITYPGTAIGIILATVNHFFHIFSLPIVPDLWMSFYGLLAGGGFLFLISEGYFRLRGKVGLGMGDVKLLAMTGVLLGPETALVTIFTGSFLGAIIGGLLMVLARRSFTRPLPFGPYLALGTILYIFFGPDFPHNLIEKYILGF